MHATQTISATEQRSWTYADYLRLEESSVRYEVWDGELHSMPAPELLHQRAVRNISVALWEYVREHRCGEVLWSPIDVVLDAGRRTVVQPDVVFVAEGRAERLLQRRGIFGAPDLLMEVLSPASMSRDEVRKMALYEQAGVAEYWLLDPLRREGRVYALHSSGQNGSAAQYALFDSAELSREAQSRLQSQVLPDCSIALRQMFQ